MALSFVGQTGAEEESAVVSSEEGERVVRVDGRRLETGALDSTLASSVIRGEPLREPGIDAARLLARVPGVQTTRAGVSAELSTLTLRGADSAQVPIYLAGIRLQDEVTGVGDLSRVPPWMLDRIEVYRGATPVGLSRFGMGGAVLFEPRLPGAPEARAGLEYGSWRSFGAWAGVSAGNFSGASTEEVQAASSLSYRFSQAQNDFSYRDDAGTAFDPSDDFVRRRQNADFTSHDVWSISRFSVPTASGPVRTDMILNAFGREQGVTNLSSIEARRARMRSERGLLGIQSRVPCGRARVEDEPLRSLGDFSESCQVTLSVRGAQQRQQTRDPLRELGLGADWVHLDTDRVEARASLRLRPHRIWGVGLDVAVEQGRLGIDEPGLARTRSNEQLLQGTWVGAARLGAVEVIGLGRAACFQVDGEEAGQRARVDRCDLEARAGAKWALHPLVALRTNLSRAVRPPTLGERYGISAGARGNPALLPEEGLSTDLGVLFTIERDRDWTLWVDASGFARFASQMIAYQRSALGYVRPYNVADARYLGAELAAESLLLQHVRLRSSWTLLDPRDTSEGLRVNNDLIPLVSRLVSVNELEVFDEPDIGIVERWSLTSIVSYRGGRVADPAGLIVIPEQFLVDVSAAVLFFERRVALRARIENLFDVFQFDTVGYPLPGRSFFTSLELVH